VFDRKAIWLELNEFTEEIRDITYSTNFNGIPLLRGQTGEFLETIGPPAFIQPSPIFQHFWILLTKQLTLFL